MVTMVTMVTTMVTMVTNPDPNDTLLPYCRLSGIILVLPVLCD